MSATIFLEYVCPTLGVVIGSYMFYAPVRDVQNAVARGSLGDLNPLPWAFMLGNCAAWVLYSILIRNFFVFVGNLPGLLLSVWLNLAASKVLYMQQQGFVPVSSSTPSSEQGQFKPPNHDYWVMGIVTAWMGVVSVVGFGDSISLDTKRLIVGLGANINLSFFYGAPLSTILKVMKERNTASIHLLTMAANTANGIFWGAYGLAVLDYYIFIPNGMGALMGFVQFALYMTLPRKMAEEKPANKTEGVRVIADEQSTHDEAVESGLTAPIADNIEENHPVSDACKASETNGSSR